MTKERISGKRRINDRIGNFLAFFLLISMFTSCINTQKVTETKTVAENALVLPLGGNAWKEGEGQGRITNRGISHWGDKSVSYTAYIRLGTPGVLSIWLDGKGASGTSEIALSVKGKKHQIQIKKEDNTPIYVGDWKIKDTGYVAIRIQGISKEGKVFANVENLLLSGSATEGNNNYVKNNEGNFFYWGRRGPSVHLRYILPKEENAEWFYNEVTVPKGKDVIGGYYMADGFSGGYFGMQVNRPNERRVLFSVWSPYDTNNPEEIPEDDRIELLKKGEDVHAGKFGNEGSGGQSYLKYMWKAGNTYKFLLHGVPDGDNHTIYTAYFYAPEEGKWKLIASFRRPKTHSYLKGLHSFLENFSPRYGDKEQYVSFGNQWIRTDKGEWIALDRAQFTTDATGGKGYRKDYAGGAEGSLFYLKNCGFFNDFTKPRSYFNRESNEQQPPEIDFPELP